MNFKTITTLSGFILGAAAFLGSPAAAEGDVAQDAFAQFAECAGIDSDKKRLACYDELVQPMQVAAEIAPVEKARNKARENAFGAEGFADKKELEKIQRLAGIESEITKISVDSARFLKITLANGQVWKQHYQDRIIPTPKPGEAETVLIRRTMLGDYIMHLEPKGRKIRVDRVK
ncbi:MAG: hypothetical protein DHS20C05_14940 [Hyphococcus sp.]|nr:MAG: hypothetical protein DHS20C05_14940 [Marinicaulis sp.]